MSTAKSFACPGCGQSFDWNPRIAGRKLVCACGQTINIPATLESATQTYDLDDEMPPPGKLVLDASGREVLPAQPVQTLDYQRPLPPMQSDELIDLAQSRRRDVIVPAVLLGISLFVLLLLLGVLIRAGRPPGYIAGNLALRLGWDVGMTFLASLVIAKLVDASFGAIHIAVLKISALAVTRFAIWALFGMTIRDISGDVVGFGLSLFALFWMLSYLFELDFRETLFAATMLTLIRWISYFGLWRVLP